MQPLVLHPAHTDVQEYCRKQGIAFVLSERLMAGRAIRLPEVCTLTGMSRATIWRKARAGSFPQPFHLSHGITTWDEGVVLDWIHSKQDNVVYLNERRTK